MDDNTNNTGRSRSGRARKRAIRARQQRTGESYVAAARHHDQDPQGTSELPSRSARSSVLGYPIALVAGPEHGDRGLNDGLKWLSVKVDELGGQPMIYAPQMSNIRENPILENYTRSPGVAIGTWRAGTTYGWSGGPVLAAWPTLDKLGEIAADRRTTALCVVPWVPGELDAWVAAMNPELVGPATAPGGTITLDPVVVEGLKTLTAMVNHANNLAGSYDRRDAVAVLRTLKDGGYSLPADHIYSWAISNKWPARGAGRLQLLAASFEAGKRPQLKGTYPLRDNILEIWRTDARAVAQAAKPARRSTNSPTEGP